MFEVLSEGPFSEEIGSAVPIENGFKVSIYNGNPLLVVKSKKFIGRFEIFEKKDGKVLTKTGAGKQMDYACNWIQLNLENNTRVYINLGPQNPCVEELEEVMAI